MVCGIVYLLKLSYQIDLAPNELGMHDSLVLSTHVLTDCHELQFTVILYTGLSEFVETGFTLR